MDIKKLAVGTQVRKVGESSKTEWFVDEVSPHKGKSVVIIRTIGMIVDMYQPLTQLSAEQWEIVQ